GWAWKDAAGAAAPADSPEGGILPAVAQVVAGLGGLSHTRHLSGRPRDDGLPAHIPPGNRRRRVGWPPSCGWRRPLLRWPGWSDVAVVRGLPRRPARDVRAGGRCGVLGAGQAIDAELGGCVGACGCGVPGRRLVDRPDERVIG